MYTGIPQKKIMHVTNGQDSHRFLEGAGRGRSKSEKEALGYFCKSFLQDAQSDFIDSWLNTEAAQFQFQFASPKSLMCI